jgi:hypothetical protein
MRIITDHIRAVEDLAATSTNSLNHATLRTSYEHAINLAHTLHSSENVTDRFAVLVTENEDLMLERDTTIANCNALTMWVMQLEAQLMQTLALMTATTNSSPPGVIPLLQDTLNEWGFLQVIPQVIGHVTNRQTPPFRSDYWSHRNVGGWGNYLVILFVGKKIIINKVGRKGLPWWGTTAGLGQQ